MEDRGYLKTFERVFECDDVVRKKDGTERVEQKDLNKGGCQGSMRFCAVPKEPTLESFSGVAGGSTTFWALLGVAGGRALEGRGV